MAGFLNRFYCFYIKKDKQIKNHAGTFEKTAKTPALIIWMIKLLVTRYSLIVTRYSFLVPSNLISPTRPEREIGINAENGSLIICAGLLTTFKVRR